MTRSPIELSWTAKKKLAEKLDPVQHSGAVRGQYRLSIEAFNCQSGSNKRYLAAEIYKVSKTGAVFSIEDSNLSPLHHKTRSWIQILDPFVQIYVFVFAFNMSAIVQIHTPVLCVIFDHLGEWAFESMMDPLIRVDGEGHNCRFWNLFLRRIHWHKWTDEQQCFFLFKVILLSCLGISDG